MLQRPLVLAAMSAGGRGVEGARGGDEAEVCAKGRDEFQEREERLCGEEGLRGESGKGRGDGVEVSWVSPALLVASSLAAAVRPAAHLPFARQVRPATSAAALLLPLCFCSCYFHYPPTFLLLLLYYFHSVSTAASWYE